MYNFIFNSFRKIKPLLLLLGILLIGYLPVSSFLFSLKNDAFTDNFPNKYFFSEALHSGIFPLWTPYLNFGYPIYADFGFAFYNPITWIFGLIGYNAYSFTLEVLMYIFIGGFSMFTLCKSLFKSSSIAIICGAMFMCSGFFIGNLQHINFLTGAALLPLVVHFFIKLFQNPLLKNCLSFTLASFLLIACGHPAIPIGTFYFLLILLAGLMLYKPIQFGRLKSFLLFTSTAFLLLILLFLPAIYALYSVYPYYGFTHQEILKNQGSYFNFKSIISIFFPFFSNAKEINWNNDISMRNIYFSFTGLLFSLFALSQLKKKNVLLIVFGTLILFVLSIDGKINELVFNNLPLLNFIRTNGEFRVFNILLLIVLAGFGLQQFYHLPKDKFINVSKRIKWILYLFLIPITLLFLYAFFHQNITNLFYSKEATGIKSFIKSAMGALSAYDFIFINSFVLLVFIVLNILFITSLKRLKWIVIIDMIFMCWTCLPFTGVGKTSVSGIQTILNDAPKGFPPPPLHPISENKVVPVEVSNLIGNYSYYNKQIGVTALTDYPSYFTTTLQFLESNQKDILKKPFIFFKENESKSSLKIINFTPNEISIDYNNFKKDSLVLLQNKYLFWNAFIDGKSVTIKNGFQSFMIIETLSGRHNIIFKYYDENFIALFSFSASFLMLIIVLAIYYNRQH